MRFNKERRKLSNQGLFIYYVILIPLQHMFCDKIADPPSHPKCITLYMNSPLTKSYNISNYECDNFHSRWWWSLLSVVTDLVRSSTNVCRVTFMHLPHSSLFKSKVSKPLANFWWPYFFQTDDDLNVLENERQPQLFGEQPQTWTKWKMANFVRKMEGHLNVWFNGRQPQCLAKRRRLASFSLTWVWHSSASACLLLFPLWLFNVIVLCIWLVLLNIRWKEGAIVNILSIKSQFSRFHFRVLHLLTLGLSTNYSLLQCICFLSQYFFL